MVLVSMERVSRCGKMPEMKTKTSENEHDIGVFLSVGYEKSECETRF